MNKDTGAAETPPTLPLPCFGISFPSGFRDSFLRWHGYKPESVAKVSEDSGISAFWEKAFVAGCIAG